MSTVRVYVTDHHYKLTGDLKDRWNALEEASDCNPRRSASFAIWQALQGIKRAVYALEIAQGVKQAPYIGHQVDDPDNTILAMIDDAEVLLAARAAKIARQPAPPQFRCAGAHDGCAARVYVQGEYCDRCQTDEQ